MVQVQSKILALLGVAATLIHGAQSKAVFAHYMLSGCTEDHAHQDIDDAIAMGLDGFAINIGDATQSWVGPSLNYLFGYAQYRGFKLFISMDVTASGNSCAGGGGSCNGPFDYQWVWDAWKGSSAYYTVNGKALISTFSSGGLTNDKWTSWKSGLANDMVFIPDFDDTQGYYDNAAGWWNYWGNVVDGLFSWEAAWPSVGGLGGKSVGDVSVDVPVIQGAKAHSKFYMASLSTLQYKDAYGGNWYRLGDLNMPIRMANILAMNPQPDFVEYITWNDMPESHYIGNVWPEANTDAAANKYSNQATWPHNGWRPILSSFTQAFKNGKSAAQMSPVDGSVAVGAAWYKTIITSSVSCPENKPSNFGAGSDALHWTIVLNPSAASGYTAVVHAGGQTQTVSLHAGLNYGSSSGSVSAGAQLVEVKDPSGKVVYSATGGFCVSSGCPNGVYNLNYQVVPLSAGSKSATCANL